MRDQVQTKPRIIHIGAVAENILSVQIEEGWVEGGVQIPYVAEEGETLSTDTQFSALTWIDKNQKHIGVLVKDTIQGDQRFVLETLCGEALDTGKADSRESYLVNGKNPRLVWRKSKPSNMADPSYEVTMEHMVYLVLEEALVTGESYRLQFAEGLFEVSEYNYTHNPEHLRSEAVHISQIGFRPGDVSKKAYLSQWMGLGGGIVYNGYSKFHIVEESSGETVYTGKIVLQHDGTPVLFNNHSSDSRNGSSDEITINSAVYELDFSDFKLSGSYHVYVPGLGCSFPFLIDETETWLRGFKLSMEALYCQRSGIVTGEPYTSFKRPRCYHPDDGRVIYQSECSLFESGNGLNCYGTDENNFGNLVRKKTDVVVENAWGGYFDACDWDRRIQHLRATRFQLELYLMFPDFYNKLKLNIPESGNGLPDVINEGLFNLDFYRRLQLPDGGIRGGIEAEEHPILGQGGWQDTWEAYAYAPDFWSSHGYASTAARTAFALRNVDSQRSEIYRESAQRAMDWAEQQYSVLVKKEGHKWMPSAHAGIRNTRELAAVDMYRLTGEEKYDELYRELRQEHSYEAAFIYASLPNGMGDEKTKQACVHCIISAANRALEFAENAPFRLATPDPEIARTGPYGSFYTIPRNSELMRAHYLTGDSRYLEAAISACNFACGANPNNLCYTTGVGPKCPVNMLHHDSRMTGQPAPKGITVFGPHNIARNNRVGLLPFLRADCFWPGVYEWPASESYIDVYRLPAITEYTVQESIGPNVYNWGYLAAARA